jgi:uncharacterized protein (DUF302 family)
LPAIRAWLFGSLVTAALMAIAAVPAAPESPPIRKIVVALPFEEAELIVKAEAQRQNLNLVNVLDVKKGMENRDGTFRPYKIYQFCNLELGVRIYSDSPDYGAFQLCSVLIYEVDPAHTALVSARQGWTLGRLPGHAPGPSAVAAAREFERKVDEIFEAVIDEAKSKAK